MKKFIICTCILLVSILAVVFFTPTHFAVEPNHSIYYGEKIEPDDFTTTITFLSGRTKQIHLNKIDEEYAEPHITIHTNWGHRKVLINVIPFKSITTNVNKNYVGSNDLPKNFCVTITYQDNTTKIIPLWDMELSWLEASQHDGYNYFKIKWHNVETYDYVNILTKPIIQSETYPMRYQDLDTTIIITKERHADSDCFIAHIVTNNPLGLKTTYGELGMGSHQIMSEIMEYRDAILMVNGDYSDWSQARWTPIVRDSEVINFCGIPTGVNQTLGIKDDGHLYQVKGNIYEEIEYNDLRDSWTFWYGFVIRDGKQIVKHHWARAPRTFIGEVLRDDNKLEYYLVVADGRREDSIGFTHNDESDLLLARGCWIAYNLDGGGSSEMMFDGKILNIPSDGHERYDHDFIYFSLWHGVNKNDSQ